MNFISLSLLSNLCRQNFSDAKAVERDAIMGAICGCTADTNPLQVRIPAFDCLLRVAELYYSSLKPYIERLAGITSTAALGAEEDIAVRAVEFWNSIAEEEKQMALENPENCCYIVTYADPLTKMLTSLMTKVEEDHDDESYTIAQAASNCLASCAIAAENAIVDPVMAFIGASFASPQWQFRDAATVAFGCIQQGPDGEKLKPLIGASVSTLISRLAGPTKDPSVVVRDSTAWSLCKIMETNFDAVDHATHYQPLLKAIFEALNDVARVAANAAYIVHNLAPHMSDYELADGSTPLSPYFTVLVQSLIARADKDDWNEHKLRAVCYEAVTMMVSEAATEHEHPFLLMLLNEVGQRLTKAVNTTPMSMDDKANLESQLNVLTALTQELVSELDDEVKPVAAGLVELLLRAMDAQHAAAAEQAFYAIGGIADAIGEDFAALLPAVLPKVMAGIANASHGKICEAAVWASGEITRSVGVHITPYSDTVVTALLDILKRVETTRESKTSALAVFGDVASAMGIEVAKYVRGMMLMLDKAAATKPEVSSDIYRTFDGFLMLLFSFLTFPFSLSFSLLFAVRRRRGPRLRSQPPKVSRRGMARSLPGLRCPRRCYGCSEGQVRRGVQDPSPVRQHSHILLQDLAGRGDRERL
jgi:importin subunit beta-1